MTEKKKNRTFAILADRIEDAIVSGDADAALRWLEVAERLGRPVSGERHDLAWSYSIGCDLEDEQPGTVVTIQDGTMTGEKLARLFGEHLAAELGAINIPAGGAS